MPDHIEVYDADAASVRGAIDNTVYEETKLVTDEAFNSGALTPLDRGAVAVLLHVAASIDALNNGLREDGKLDNVSVPTYLKYLDELGLTPAARARIQKTISQTQKSGSKPSESGSKLAKFSFGQSA